MKKRLIQLALILGLMTLTCAAAQASESPDSGFQNWKVEDAYANYVSVTALDADNKTVEAQGDAYPGAAKMKVTYRNPQSNSEYLLIVLSDDDRTPSVDNMAYIDQKTASANEMDFTIYPKKVESSVKSVTYSVYMSSNSDASAGNGVTGYDKVASFDYYSNALDATPGDVNDDGNINVQDALLVLQAFVGSVELTETQKIAADVSGDTFVNVADALLILQYFVGAITEFPNASA